MSQYYDSIELSDNTRFGLTVRNATTDMTEYQRNCCPIGRNVGGNFPEADVWDSHDKTKKLTPRMQATPSVHWLHYHITSAEVVRRNHRCQWDILSDDRRCRGSSSTSRRALNHIDRSGHIHPAFIYTPKKFTYTQGALTSLHSIL